MAELVSPDYDDWTNAGAVLAAITGIQTLPMAPPLVSPERAADFVQPVGTTFG